MVIFRRFEENIFDRLNKEIINPLLPLEIKAEPPSKITEINVIAINRYSFY